VTRKKTRKKTRPFKLGDTVVFDPSGLDPEYWASLSEAKRLKYYGPLGYGAARRHLFTFICLHGPQGDDHCMLVSMVDQHIETMRHVGDFRLATEDEV
jgi:hypothetical protein